MQNLLIGHMSSASSMYLVNNVNPREKQRDPTEKADWETQKTFTRAHDMSQRQTSGDSDSVVNINNHTTCKCFLLWKKKRKNSSMKWHLVEVKICFMFIYIYTFYTFIYIFIDF